MKVSLLSEAEEETQEAARWYEERQIGLGQAFLEALSRGLESIEQHPTRHLQITTVPAHRNVRRVLLKRFPYKIIYEILPTEVLVLAVAHARRRPGYWKHRS